MLDLVRKHGVNVLDHGVRRSSVEGYVVDALVDEREITGLEQKGYRVQRNEDVDKEGKERQKEVGRGNRYVKRSAT